MQNKLFAIMITALLVMLMAGPAMCATYDSSVILENKDSSWAIIEDDISALVEYNASGETFDWRVTGTTPHPGEYCLIYYADKPNRFDEWGGDNPGALICTVKTDNNRVIENNQNWPNSGSTDLEMNLPCCPDANMNINEHNYSGAPDNYAHSTGAKLWLVPSSNYAEPAMTAWDPARYLFETDLIWYGDTDLAPEVVHTETDYDEYEAGEEVMITVTVCDEDGVEDLENENMVVTANFSEYGVEELVVLEFDEMFGCNCAEYTGTVIITEAGEICGDVVATDPSGLSDSDKEVCFNVTPASCIIVIKGTDKSFTNSIIYLGVYCEDEYGNALSCCSNFGTSITGDASRGVILTDATCSGYIQIVDYGIPGVVTVAVCCTCGGEQVQDTHNITYMKQIGGLSMTADPELLYEISTCGDDLDCADVSAQLTDESGNPIPMPGIDVTFTVEGDSANSTTEVTDDNGTAITRVCMDEDYLSPITVEAQMKCITAEIDIDIDAPELYRVEIINETTRGPVDAEMNCTEEQDLNYACWTDHDTRMYCPECPPATWDATLGEIDEDGVFTAFDSGTAVVEVNVSGVIETAEIVINCTPNCAEIPDGCICSPHPFEIASGSVTLSGNFTETGCEITGWACVEAIGNPIDWTNDTRGAIVNVSEDRTEDVMLNLSGEGDTWKYNETTGNWSKYANGSISEVSNGTYALVTPGVDPDPCEGVTCEALTCVGVDRYNMTCEDGSCVAYMLIEANCVGCGYGPDPTPTPTVRRSSGGSGGTYPPGWGSSTSTGSSESTENATVVDPTPDDPTPADVKPTVNLPGDTTLDTTPDETEDDAPGGADPTNAILVVLGILALLVIGYVLYRKSQN